MSEYQRESFAKGVSNDVRAVEGSAVVEFEVFELANLEEFLESAALGEVCELAAFAEALEPILIAIKLQALEPAGADQERWLW